LLLAVLRQQRVLDRRRFEPPAIPVWARPACVQFDLRQPREILLDHPKNFGFPTYWHARGYGLFAANAIGQKALTEGKQPATNLTLEPGQSTTFRYRFVILEGTATGDRIEREFSEHAR